MKRIVWLGMLSVMAGLAPAVEKPAAQDNETAVVPKPGTKAFYELRIVGRCALDGDCLVPITTTEPVSSAISRTLPPGLTRLGMTTGRPLLPGLTRLGGVRNHAKWIEGHAIQSLGTNRVVIGQAETNASGVVFHRPSCVADLRPETPVSEVGTDIRVLAVPDGSVSCETADGNITSRRTLQVYREVRQPTFEEYKAIYERESRPVPLEPIVSLERETRLPAVGAIPVRRKPTVVSDTPTTPVSDAPFAVLTTNGTVRIVKYSGTDAKVVIPERINGLPVVALEVKAFDGCHGMTEVTIPATVTSIHDHAFHGCPALVSILVEVMNPVYSSSADGVLFNMEKTRLVRFPMGKQGEYTVPQRTTEIGSHAFEECPGLTEITLPERLEEIGGRAFWGCSSLKTILFKGDAPKAADRSVFQGCSQATVYRRSGAKGWGETFGGRPVKLREDADFGSTGKTNALAPRISNTPTSVDVKTEETGTFRATLTDFNPPSPSILGHGDRVEYMIHYEIDAEGEYYIFTRPMFKGNPAPNYGSHPSGRYRRGTGELDGFWDFYKDAKVDQIKISFHKREDGSDRRDRREIVKEMYVDVDYEFRDKYADVKPNPLYDGIRISANMSLQNAARLRDAFSKDGAKRVDSHDCGASARATSIGADVGIKTVQRALELCRQHMPDAKRFYIFSEDRYRKTINFGSGRSPNIPDMPPDLFSKLLAPDLTLEEFHRLVNDHNATATSVASPPAPVPRPPAPVRPSATLKVGDPAPPLAQGKYVQGEPVAAFEKGALSNRVEQTEEPDLTSAPEEFRKHIEKTKQEISEKGGFAVAGVVLDGEGTFQTPGHLTVVLKRNEGAANDTYKYEGGWFVSRVMPSGMAKDNKLVAAAFIHDPVEVPLTIRTNCLTWAKVSLLKTKPENLTSIAGTVRDEEGHPLAGANVALTIYRSNGYFSSQAERQCVSDGTGHYSFGNITQQPYLINAKKQGYSGSWAEIDFLRNFALRAQKKGCEPKLPKYATPLVMWTTWAKGGSRCSDSEHSDFTLAFPRAITIDYEFQTNNTFTGEHVVRGLTWKTHEGINFSEGLSQGQSRDLELETKEGEPFFRHFFVREKSHHGHYDLGEVPFESVKTLDETKAGSIEESTCFSNHVYGVRTYAGQYAKFVVRKIEPVIPIQVGDPAPPLAQGKYVQGEPVAAFEKGKVYVVEFWATWCGPCRTVIPHVNALQEKYKDKGLVVIGQNVWQRGENVEGDVAEFVKQMGSNMTYRVALDRDDAMSGTWMKAAGRGGIPSAFVVDREGKIAWIGHPGSGLDEAVGTLLGNIGQGARP